MKKLYRILVPGVIFQSVLIGGGYATGREVMEFSARFGDSGLVVVLIAFLLFALTLSFSFEIARQAEAFNYRRWSIETLGKFWFIFDILFLILAVVAIAVVVSGVSAIIQQFINIHSLILLGVVIVIVGGLMVLGDKWLVRFKLGGTTTLYIVYIAIFVYLFKNLASSAEPIDASGVDLMASGIKYVGYNMIAFPACLFAVSKLKSRSEVIYSAVFSAALVILPMLLLTIILSGRVDLIDSEVPLFDAMQGNVPILVIYGYYLAMGLTLIETTSGLIHAILSRIENQLEQFDSINFDNTWRLLSVIVVIAFAAVLLNVGIIGLVANWYGNLSWAFLIVLVVGIVYFFGIKKKT